MTFKCGFKLIEKFCKFVFFIVIFFNFILISKLHANSFKINEIEVSEDFNLDFNKKKVFDKAFESAFFQLISTVVVSKDIKKIEKTNLSTIKSLIDSFTVSDEKFFEKLILGVVIFEGEQKRFQKTTGLEMCCFLTRLIGHFSC